MAKVLFLDIDGVLNSNFWNDSHQREISDGTLVDEEKIKLLASLVKRANAKIILHSGWRFWFDDELRPLGTEAERLAEMLAKEDLFIDGVTPDLTTEEIRRTKKFSLVKADEILLWLKLHNDITGWVVLDDLDLHSIQIEQHQVKTDPTIGLTREDIKEAEKILEGSIYGGSMKNASRQKLAAIAREQAQKPFHGYIEDKESNIDPIIKYFPKWNLRDADKLWCAAFVYYCCIEAGFAIPYRPNECVTCHLAGCIGWEEYAIGDNRIEYYKHGESFLPEAGDIVLYDRVFIGQEHDHIGVILEVSDNYIIAAEGNIDNKSGVIKRRIDDHIRAYIRIPDGYRY